MGWGVADDETFEALLEDRLNRSPLGTRFKSFELLNFGVPGHQPPQQLASFERAVKLQVNTVLYVATGRELRRSANYLAEVVRKGIPIPYPALQAIVARAGVTRQMDETEALRRLEPLGGDILRVVYQTIAERCRELGIEAVWIFLPQVRAGTWQEETPAALQMAQEAGFMVLNLDDVYRGHDVETLRLAEWDDHPNALGHRLVAERLYAEMAERSAALFAAAAR
jgi:hypothetical protein